MTTSLLLNLVSAAVLTGLVWTVQVVHYPAFADVDEDAFPAFHAAHGRRMAVLVGPPWALEGVTSIALVAAPPAGVGPTLPWVGLAIAAVPVVVTFGWSVPAHGRLARGFDGAVHARLVRTNWWRTLGWTAHAAVAGLMVVRALS